MLMDTTLAIKSPQFLCIAQKQPLLEKMNNYSKVTRGSKRKLQKINNIKEVPLQFINEKKLVFPE